MAKLKVLFVCSAGISRSVTAAKMANRWYGDKVEARAAGIHALERGLGGGQVTMDDAAWADEIVVMETQHGVFLRKDGFAHAEKVHCLHIADVYEPLDPELKALVKQSIDNRLQNGFWLSHNQPGTDHRIHIIGE